MTLTAAADSTAVERVVAADRIGSLDVLRGMALIGMFLVHFNDQSTAAATSGLSAWYQKIVALFFEERFWTMFGILFGAGFAVQLRRAEMAGRRFGPMYLRRLLVLAAIGLCAHAVFGYHVLFDYAVWGLPLLLFRRWSIRALVIALVISATSWSVFLVAQAAFRVAAVGEAAYRSERAADAAANQAFRQANNEAQNAPDYRTVFAARLRHIGWFYRQQYEFLPVNTLTLFLIGMIAVRLGLFDRPSEHRRLIVALMTFGVASWAAAMWWLPGRGGPLGSPLVPHLAILMLKSGLGLIRETWLTFTYMGAVLLLVARDPAWLRRLGAFGWTGRMALTNYLIQIAILDLAFSNYSLHLRVSPLAGLAAGLLLFALDAMASRWWLTRFRFGPFEWIWRSLTYLERQPFSVAALIVLCLIASAALAPSASVRRQQSAARATVQVATVAQLQSAVASLASGTTIVVAPGMYRLRQELQIGRGVTHVAIRGATGNRADVVILGSGMKTQGVNIAIKVQNAQDVLIADLSIGETYWHPIQLQGEQRAERVHIRNVRLFDAGEQFVKSTVDSRAPDGVDDVVVENSLIEYTTIGPVLGYTEGIDVHHGANWTIRHNVFRNIHVPPGGTYRNRPAILVWSGSRDAVVDGNTIINCERGIILGAGPQAGYAHSHSGGSIVNNFIYRTEPVNADAGISVWDSPGTRVFHNTVIQNGTYPAAIEYRFPGTTGVEIANNLTDGAIEARDGARGTVYSNFTQATHAFFVNAAAGDLHLAPTARAAIDRGVILSSVPIDWDGDPRPSGAAPDLGADEWVPKPRAAGLLGLQRPDRTDLDAAFPRGRDLRGRLNGIVQIPRFN